MEFSKKMLIFHLLVTLCLCAAIVVGTFARVDTSTMGGIAEASFTAGAVWGGFYLWKSKNENRAKYAQKFVRLFAKEHGVDAAIRLAEVVLKD